MADKIREALLQFCETIEATGGVKEDVDGYTCPVIDDEWIDLGEAYLSACAALGREPMSRKL